MPRPRRRPSNWPLRKPERATATKELAGLKLERPQVKADLTKATTLATRLRHQRDLLTKRVAKARTAVAAAGTSTRQVAR